jgi:NAD(P)-dependent dehydrogenase (short-subunit alcohol dehydrogenase family)
MPLTLLLGYQMTVLRVSLKKFLMNPKTILITGANRGIGKAVAAQFLEQDYQVILTARNHIEGLNTLKAMAGPGKIVYFHQLDAADKASMLRFE